MSTEDVTVEVTEERLIFNHRVETAIHGSIPIPAGSKDVGRNAVMLLGLSTGVLTKDPIKSKATFSRDVEVVNELADPEYLAQFPSATLADHLWERGFRSTRVGAPRFVHEERFERGINSVRTFLRQPENWAITEIQRIVLRIDSRLQGDSSERVANMLLVDISDTYAWALRKTIPDNGRVTVRRALALQSVLHQASTIFMEAQ